MKRKIESREALSRRDFLPSTALIGAGLAIGTSVLDACAERPAEHAKDTP